jgi:hypothetical protein
METVIALLNRMQADGILERFAIGGGIAAIYYLEAYQTDDIDVFISPVVVSERGLVSFGRIYSYLEGLGYTAEREYVRIEDWLVQFLPAAESVQEEAVAAAKRVTYGGTPTLIFSPEHLAAEFFRSGRSKDQIRVIALLDSGKMDFSLFQDIIRRHGLEEKWSAFASRFDLEK